MRTVSDHRGSVPLYPLPAAPGSFPMIDEQKRALRRAATERRSLLARDAGPGIGEILADRFLDAIPLPPKGAIASGFWSMGDEIDVKPLLHRLHDLGYRCCLPVTVKRGLPLLFRQWQPGDTLVSGGFGTSIPGPAAPELQPDLLIVPLLAFDRRGYRLGYGGGFYDRTLQALRATGPRLAVGVGLSGQEVSEVPREDYDQRLDWMVTEREAFRIERPSGESR